MSSLSVRNDYKLRHTRLQIKLQDGSECIQVLVHREDECIVTTEETFVKMPATADIYRSGTKAAVLDSLTMCMDVNLVQ